MKQEIERKWLLARPVNELLNKHEYGEVTQLYLVVNKTHEVRIRRVRGPIWGIPLDENHYWMTVKSKKNGTLYTRDEMEIELTAERFNELQKASIGLVQKIRYEVPLGDLTAEIDIFSYPFPWLKIVEVEFQDEGQAWTFNPPDWFGEEVTHNSIYQNHAIATATSSELYL